MEPIDSVPAERPSDAPVPATVCARGVRRGVCFVDLSEGGVAERPMDRLKLDIDTVMSYFGGKPEYPEPLCRLR